MFKSKPIGWITAGTLVCAAGLAVACRLKDGKGTSAQANPPAVAEAPAAPAEETKPVCVTAAVEMPAPAPSAVPDKEKEPATPTLAPVPPQTSAPPVQVNTPPPDAVPAPAPATPAETDCKPAPVDVPKMVDP